MHVRNTLIEKLKQEHGAEKLSKKGIFFQRRTDFVDKNVTIVTNIIATFLDIDKIIFRWRQVQDENQSLYELGLHERGEILCEFQVCQNNYVKAC